MYFCLIIAFLMTFLWIDNLVITSINARVNPYQKTEEDNKFDKYNAIKRTIYIIIASIGWSIVIYFLAK